MAVSQDGSSTDGVGWDFAPALQIWYHIAVTCDLSESAASKFELFIDGVSQGNGTVIADSGVTALFDTFAAFAVGAYNNATSSRSDGLIDDARLWNRVRTATEINASMNIELAGDESNLVGYWKFNGDYTDATPNGNDLTANGSPEFVADVP